MILSSSRQGLLESLSSVRHGGLRVGLVPTMGFLHEGHLSLVDLAKKQSDFVAVSIFVNPLQFGEGEDLDRYPRDLDRDLDLLRGRGADLVFHPSAEEMYPEGPVQVTVDPGPMGRRLCGIDRPSHFRGVLTVVARLFGLFTPQLAVFGQKDYQQAVLIKQMVSDLEMDVEIALGPIVREADGLALSSRNVYLSHQERGDALGLRRGLAEIQKLFRRGVRDVEELLGALAGTMDAHPLLRLQYAEIVHPGTLEPLERAEPGSVAVVAAHCGHTRIIDNTLLEP